MCFNVYVHVINVQNRLYFVIYLLNFVVTYISISVPYMKKTTDYLKQYQDAQYRRVSKTIISF